MSSAGDEQLVERVLRRVLDALGQSGTATPAQAPAAVPAAAPLPPKPSQPARGGTGGGGGRVWLTARMLAERVGGQRSVTLAVGEYLTPAAWDYASARGIEVLREAAPAARTGPTSTSPAPGRVAPAALTRTVGLVVYRPAPKVEAALAAVTRAGVATVGFAEDRCWMVNLRAMCERINAGELAGGVVLDRYAAAAMVLAGKIRGIRPVQGVSVPAVEAGLRQFDANVLVIGHATVSVYEIRSMIDRFAAGRRMGRDRTVLLDAVEQLEGRA